MREFLREQLHWIELDRIANDSSADPFLQALALLDFRGTADLDAWLSAVDEVSANNQLDSGTGIALNSRGRFKAMPAHSYQRPPSSAGSNGEINCSSSSVRNQSP